VPPVLARHPRGVNFAAADLKPPALEQKIVRADGKGVPGRFIRQQRGN
jgi:hypothetical protein